MNLMVSSFLGATLIASPTVALMQPAETESMRIYAAARPYMNLSPSELKSKVRTLDGLKIEDDPTKLDDILQKTGATIMEQSPRVPNLVAHEEIAPESMPTSPEMVKTTSRGAVVVMDPISQEPQLIPDWKLYEYFIRVGHGEDGLPIFEETRTKIDKKGALASPQGVGFGQQWLMFSPARQSESRFRYLGVQKVNGHMTYVVAFAQQPSKVTVPGELKISGQSYPLLYQGVVWIDQSTYRIVKLRTDLLAPIAPIKLDEVTTTTNFSDTNVPGLNITLVMPKQVEITWNVDGRRTGEMHRYNDYRLFKATARILPN
jgi:hypothetical protein